MKAALKGTYGSDTKTNTAVATLALSVGDCLLKASVSDKSLLNGGGILNDGVVFGIEKPDFFSIHYYVKEKDFKFQCNNTLRLAQKPLKFGYTHNRKDKENILEGTLELNSSNSVTAKYTLGGNCKEPPFPCSFKYSHLLGDQITTFEPSYDFKNDLCTFSASRKLTDDDFVKATIKYQESRSKLGGEWTKTLNSNANFKISADVSLADNKYIPEFSAETTWSFDV
ncbi:hypothetical protein ACFE04_013205 [Oxalis oulophora]